MVVTINQEDNVVSMHVQTVKLALVSSRNVSTLLIIRLKLKLSIQVNQVLKLLQYLHQQYQILIQKLNQTVKDQSNLGLIPNGVVKTKEFVIKDLIVLQIEKNGQLPKKNIVVVNSIWDVNKQLKLNLLKNLLKKNQKSIP